MLALQGHGSGLWQLAATSNVENVGKPARVADALAVD